MSLPDRRLITLGFLLLLLAALAFSLSLPGGNLLGSPLRADLFVALLAVSAGIYFLAVRHILRSPPGRHGIWLIVGLALAMRAVLLPAPPLLSSDIYRYVWDGRVQAAGINPYKYVPADPALAKLRDAAVYPLINRADYARTIYPPAAQLVFAAIDRLTDSVLGMKLAMFGFECLAMLCLLRLLALAGLPAERLLIYAWNPLVLWAFACDGHVDAIAIAFLSLALLARARKLQGMAGGLLACAALVKFVPVVVAPAFLRGGRFWRPALAGAAIILGLYALYISAGWHVLGFLPTYGDEEGLDSGSGFWLLAGLSHLTDLPEGTVTLYVLAAAFLYLLLALRSARGKPGDIVTLCRDSAVLAGFVMAAVSAHYPWYFAWLALPSVLAPVPWVIWLSTAPVLLYLDPFNERFFWPSLVYLPAIALALRGLRRPHTAMTEGSPACPHPAP
jgi:alpha-1,6-mannosyltransferase